jgi:hypothetical protein
MTDNRRATTLLPTEPAGRAVIAKFFRALGDPNRLRSSCRTNSSRRSLSMPEAARAGALVFGGLLPEPTP